MSAVKFYQHIPVVQSLDPQWHHPQLLVHYQHELTYTLFGLAPSCSQPSPLIRTIPTHGESGGHSASWLVPLTKGLVMFALI